MSTTPISVRSTAHAPRQGPPTRAQSWSLLVRTALRVGVALTVGLGVGCASMKPTKSGFLSSYDGMVKGTSSGVRQSPPTPDALAEIQTIVVQPPVWLATSRGGAEFDQEQRESVLAALEDALKEQLGALKPIVDHQGGRSLVVRAAVTDAARSNPVVNVATSVLIGPITNGGAAIEIEVLGPDGALVASMVYADTGGVLDLLDSYSESGHARKVARRAAEELRQLFARSTSTVALGTKGSSAPQVPSRRGGR